MGSLIGGLIHSLISIFKNMFTGETDD